MIKQGVLRDSVSRESEYQGQLFIGDDNKSGLTTVLVGQVGSLYLWLVAAKNCS